MGGAHTTIGLIVGTYTDSPLFVGTCCIELLPPPMTFCGDFCIKLGTVTRSSLDT